MAELLKPYVMMWIPAMIPIVNFGKRCLWIFLEGCCLNFQIYFYWLCFLFTVCCRFVILVPQNSLPTPQKCHLLEHIRGWHLRWLAFQFSLLLTLSILQKVFVEWFSIPAEVGYPHMKEMAMFIRKLKLNL